MVEVEKNSAGSIINVGENELLYTVAFIGSSVHRQESEVRHAKARKLTFVS